MLPPRLLALPCLLLLGGCALLAPDSGAGNGDATDWLEFGATLEQMPDAEFESLYVRAVAEYQSAPSPVSALRLALLQSSPRNRELDAAAAASLLASVIADPNAGGNERNFAAFYRPLVVQLAEREQALAEATAESSELRGQLDALRELEEQLNGDD